MLRQTNQVRREQTERELKLLAHECTSWLKQRRDNDPFGFYKTQLGALETLLQGAIKTLQQRISALTIDQPVGEIYAAARACDEAIIWLRRLWDYFRVKFDQRNVPELNGLLKAADEVVWSCYRQAIVRAKMADPGLKVAPSPLAFIEPEYSPAAIQSDRPLPPSLRFDAAEGLLGGYVKTLPIPLLRLPFWCVDAPWWLVYIAHEVGHHILHDLGLIKHFREGIRQVASTQQLSPDHADAWGLWSEEIFADLYSVILLGPWAIWAIVEVEWAPPGDLLRSKQLYPAPVIRLALMVAMAEALGLNPSPALRGLDLAALAKSDPRTALDWRVVAPAVDFALGPLRDNLGRLKDLCRFDAKVFSPQGKVSYWAQQLRGDDQLVVEQNPETARQIACGALAAWTAIARLTDPDDRERQRLKLATRTKQALSASAPPGTRAEAGAPDLEQQGATLAEDLLSMIGQEHNRV